LQQVVQRYTEAQGHRIANDHTAAVKIGKNNKLLYATQARIQQANQVMTHKNMPLSLNAGAQKNGLVNDQILLTVTPQFRAEPGNLLPDNVTPQAHQAHNVLLPSECEKGAISIIGTYTKIQKSVGNARNYKDAKHYSGRIAEHIAQSNAPGDTKTGCYDEWHTLQNGLDKATSAWNRNSYDRADIDEMFTDLDDHALRGEFHSDFSFNQAQTAYEATYIFSATTKAHALFEKIICRFDRKMTDIETKVMKTVNTGTVGEHQELVTSANARDQLKGFFINRSYNKAIIDQAINLVPQSVQLLQMLQAGFTANRAGDKYESTATFFKDSKLETMAKTVLQSIDKHVVALTARNSKSLQAGSGLNAEVNPDIGQSYGIVGGQYNFTDAGRWNWHWASVIIKTNGDNVTMEAHATHKVGNEAHNKNWDFKMYGTAANSGETFHDEWKGKGFGNAPVTVLGVPRDNSHLLLRLNERGISTLNQITSIQARQAANDLFMFLNPIANSATSKQQLILNYLHVLPDISSLPASFRANYLNADLASLDTAMQDLINDAGTDKEQLAQKAKAHKDATYLRNNLRTFYTLTSHYIGHKKKTGTFV
jgi:hypothetical protein